MASADLHDDVRSFLSDLQFEGQLEASISSALREQDVYSMDDLRSLSKDDMKQMGITIGPRNKIWNKLQAPLPLTDRPCQTAVVSGAPCTQASVLDTPAASICHGVSDLRLASHASFICRSLEAPRERCSPPRASNPTRAGRPVLRVERTEEQRERCRMAAMSSIIRNQQRERHTPAPCVNPTRAGCPISLLAWLQEPNSCAAAAACLRS
jgi:hypothetical protein